MSTQIVAPVLQQRFHFYPIDPTPSVIAADLLGLIENVCLWTILQQTSSNNVNRYISLIVYLCRPILKKARYYVANKLSNSATNLCYYKSTGREILCAKSLQNLPFVVKISLQLLCASAPVSTQLSSMLSQFPNCFLIFLSCGEGIQLRV